MGGSGAVVLKTAGSATERGRLLGQMLFAPMLQLLPQMQTATDCTQQTFDITIVAHALVWYQRVNGRYPDSLAKLAPTYLSTIPGDLFSGKELVYRPNADGFLLYSVGANGVDDGASGQDGQPPGDDIVVRIPYPSKP
ncbi:hypothetical protein [Gemmata massiliana]|uniref:hypothetical protein n=1 Tax=Gemmata massiliana TaxID=1210884 RepID=UPI0013A6F23B|nr:hypothetical protein [Gemmata massiliana]